MRPADYAELIRSRATHCDSECRGLYVRILRGRTPEDFVAMSDDPDRKVVMFVGGADSGSLVGLTSYEMLNRLGYTEDYIADLLESGQRFKLLVFKSNRNTFPTIWGTLPDVVGRIYSTRVGDMVARCLTELRDLTFTQIEQRAGFSFAEVNKLGKDDPRFMTVDRLLMSEGRVEHVRAFLYFSLHLKELFSGDGYTYTPDGRRGMKEHFALNKPVTELKDAVLVDLEVCVPVIKRMQREISKLHALPGMVYILQTGAAGQLVRDLWQTPGSSATILGHRFCYAQEDLLDAVEVPGRVIEITSWCSEATGRIMASTAYRKARLFADQRGKGSEPVVGLGITSVVCGKEELPDGKIECANLAIMTERGVNCIFLKLRSAGSDATPKQRMAHRVRQGELIDLVALNLILWAFDGVEQVPLDPEWLLFMESEQFVRQPNGDVIIHFDIRRSS